MPAVNLPPSLASAYWDKQQKGPLAKLKPPATKLPDELKSLQRMHLALDWAALDGGKLDRAEQVAAAEAALEEAAKGRVKALLEQVRAVEAAASRFETEARKDREFPKETLTAVATILRSAEAYRDEVEAALDAARKALAARAKALAGQKPKGAGAEAAGADSKAAKLVRSRAMDAIRKVRKPAPGAKPVRFIVVQGKLAAATYLGPSVGPTQEKLLKGLLPGEAPYKTFKDPNGQLVWEKNALTFVSDVLPSGALKKMQLWLRKILKLNLKLRVRKTNGEVEETEGEDLPEEALQADPAERQAAAADFQQRLAALQPQVKQALAGSAGAELRALMASLTQHAKTGDFEEAAAELDEIEALLESGDGDEAGEGAADGAGRPGAEALEAWKARRAAAVASLKAVAAEVANARHADSAKAIVELQAVIKNLTEQPATLQQVDELRRYLDTDDVVDEVCELAEDFRTPLLQALDGLRGSIAA